MTNQAAAQPAPAITDRFAADRFGIEIETLGVRPETLAAVIAYTTGGTLSRNNYGSPTVTLADGRQWKVVRDCSIQAGGEASGEIVSPILTIGELPLLQEIVRAVRKAGAKVNDSCGIHIHVDGTRVDADVISRLAQSFVQREQLLAASIGLDPASHRASYCRPLAQPRRCGDAGLAARIAALSAKASREQLRAAWYGPTGGSPERYDSTRYSTLNLNSWFFRGSVEFRMFNATLHAGEVKAFVLLCLSLFDQARSSARKPSWRRPFVAARGNYDMRGLMIQAGMIGPEYANARKHLTKRLAGSASRAA